MYLEKEDVSLYYEVTGEGEPLLLIHGLIVDAGLFQETAKYLARRYKVITYDRRGVSRSRCKGENRFSIRKQVEDIRDLLDSLSIDRVYIAGASAGALIGLYFLLAYPERVRHIVLYETAMLGIMREREPETERWLEEIQTLTAQGKMNNVVLRFVRHIGSFDKRSRPRPAEVSMREMRNHDYAMKEEFPALIRLKPDLGLAARYAGKITVALGEESPDTVYVRTSRMLAETFGQEALYFPGYHNFPYDLPQEFAVCIAGVFSLNPLEQLPKGPADEMYSS